MDRLHQSEFYLKIVFPYVGDVNIMFALWGHFGA